MLRYFVKRPGFLVKKKMEKYKLGFVLIKMNNKSFRVRKTWV